MSLVGKAAVVTGAGRGIGKAISLDLASAGADIGVNDVNAETIGSTVATIQAMGRKAVPLPADISDPEAVDEMMQRALDAFGKIDILVNNAGIARDNLLVRLKKEDWDAVLGVNLTGTFLCTKAVSRHMMKQRSGRIISISSVIGFMGNAGQPNYAASKAGIVGFTKAVARELAPRGVTVNAVAPGFIETEMTRAMPERARESISQLIPVERLGKPEDVAHCVRFLASEEASYITGQVIHVNGGLLM